MIVNEHYNKFVKFFQVKIKLEQVQLTRNQQIEAKIVTRIVG